MWYERRNFTDSMNNINISYYFVKKFLCINDLELRNQTICERSCALNTIWGTLFSVVLPDGHFSCWVVLFADVVIGCSCWSYRKLFWEFACKGAECWYFEWKVEKDWCCGFQPAQRCWTPDRRIPDQIQKNLYIYMQDPIKFL